MQKITVLIWFLFTGLFLQAQSEIFISNADQEISIINIGSTGCSQAVQVNTPISLSDITLHPNGKMYGVSFSQRRVFEVNMTSGALTEIVQIAEADRLVGLTADANGVLYVTEGNVVPSDLYTVNVTTGTYVNKGPLVDGSAGDLTWSFGKLYNASDNNKLVEVNIEDPASSVVIGNFNGIVKGGDKMFALVTSFISCVETVTYGLSIMGDYYEIDLETANVNRLCTGTVDLYGATSQDEFLASECLIALDLDADNSSGAAGSDFMNTFDCLTTSSVIADTDVEVLASVLVDSLSISLVNGILDGANEFLVSGSIPGITPSTNGQQITAVNTGNVPQYDVEDFLRAMRYRNTAAIASDGVRTIEVVVFSQGATDTALAFVYIEAVDAGEDASVEFCASSAAADLFPLLGGDPDPGGIWVPPLASGTGVFDPVLDAPGTFEYIISNGCDTDTSIMVVTFSTLSTAVDLGNDTSICTGNTYLIDADIGVPGAEYHWNTSDTTASITVSAAGAYSVTVNVDGCTASDDIQIDNTNIQADLGADIGLCAGDQVILNADTGIPGTSYEWNNGAATPVLQVSTGGEYWVEVELDGCADSDTVLVTIATGGIIPLDLGPDLTICEGQSVTISSGYTTSDYNHSWNTGSTNASINTSSPGVYSLTVSNSCQSGSDAIEIFTMDCDTIIPVDTTIVPIDTTVNPSPPYEPFCDILMPSAFSPNGDSHNDVFAPLNPCPEVDAYIFRVYNRYGELLFEGNQASVWDGTFKGKQVLMDGYIWYLEWTDARRGRMREEGMVVVIR